MRRKQQGYILLQALIVIAFLTALMAMMAASQRATLKQSTALLQQRKAETAARSAVQNAMEVIEEATPGAVSQNDAWYQLGDSARQEFNLGSTTYRVQIVDEGSQLNMNSASMNQLLMLPVTQEEVDCFLDWIQPSPTARADGAKDAYYNGLQEPYNTKLAPLTTLSEILLVKDWTGSMIYTPITNVSTSLTLPTDINGNTLPLAAILCVNSGAPNTTAAGGQPINLGVRAPTAAGLARFGLPSTTVNAIIAAAPIRSFRQLLSLPGITTASARALLNGVTFTTAGRVTGKLDLNTASLTALQTLPGMSIAIAQAIVAQQANGFTSIGDIMTVGGVTPTVLAQFADDLTVGCDTFLVRAYGACSGVGYAVEAEIQLTKSVGQIISWNKINSGGPPSWWGWDTTATEPVDMQVGQ